jgi:membrane protein YdbS with pleckstrin-like domain
MSSFEIEDDAITGKSNFISTIVKRINIENIKEIEFTVGPLQRFFGLGDIAISTQASSSGGNEFSGMTLFDIKNVEDIYDLIKKNIGK